jgi:superfamily II DNA or RNA helicase
MGSLANLITSFSPDVGIRGRQFEHACKWYLGANPKYSSQLRRVWLWNDWPGRWGADAGIDLVAEAKGGDLWAIQAKAYGANYYITRADIDSFLAESNRAQFSFRLLMATTDHIGPTGRRTIDQQEKPVGRLLVSELDRPGIEWPASIDQLRAPVPRPLKPFPHNLQAVRAVVDRFNSSDRGQLVMACGTGKTLVALWAMEALKSRTTLVLFPSLGLLGQTLRVWTLNRSRPFELIAVCSDHGVARGDDTFMESASDLGMPVTTDPVAIRKFLSGNGRRVVFCTYQSSPAIAQATRRTDIVFDMVIADEAHRTAGATGTAFATVLDHKKITAKRRLFMTATPRVFTRRLRQSAAAADVVVASMDDPSVYGPVFHRLPFSEAIKKGLLSDYQVAIVAVEDRSVANLIASRRLVAPAGLQEQDAESLASAVSLAKAFQQFDLRRVISFHGSIARARAFSADFPKVIAWMPKRSRPTEEILTDYVAGIMPFDLRESKLIALGLTGTGQRALLSNCRCLSEGIDVPSIDGVAFIDPRRSEIDIIQAVGRAIRKSDEKKVATIVLPVFLTADQDPEALLQTSAFKPIWDVVRALRAHDDLLAAELDALRRSLGPRTSGKLPGGFTVDLPEGIGRGFADAFSVRLVEETTETWMAHFGELEEFIKTNGHARVPREYEDRQHFRLGGWVTQQRSLYASKSLETERTRLLARLPWWEWDPHEAQWEKGFLQLQAWVAKHGSARPLVASHINRFNLGAWVNHQRQAYARGELDFERRQRLEELPGWIWKPHAHVWETGIKALWHFVKQKGNADVPLRYVDAGYKLGLWVNGQRSKGNTGRLSAEQWAELDAIPGWTWDTRDLQWEEGFTHLTSYLLSATNPLVPAKLQTNGYNLGAWVNTQRSAHRRGKLAKSRIERLESLSGWTWGDREYRWETAYQDLRKYVKDHGAYPGKGVMSSTGISLGSWVNTQRATQKRGRLGDEKARRLETVKGWSWDDDVDQLWEASFAQVQDFVAKRGIAALTNQTRLEGFRIGQWVVTQRVAFGRGQMALSRQTRLESLPGWRWDQREANWERGFASLISYAKANGNADVPTGHVDEKGIRLWQWVQVQRRQHEKGAMVPSRASRLEGIKGWRWTSDRRDQKWESNLHLLRQYSEAHRTALVPQGFQISGVRLGAWVAMQRQLRKNGNLSKPRQKLLSAVQGWSWDPLESEWEAGLAHLRAYVNQHGDARPPAKAKSADGFGTGAWVSRQRALFARGDLSASKEERLSKLPGWRWAS